MENVEKPVEKPVEAEKPIQKRSMVERILVWGMILCLLGVVLLEWTSKTHYAATLAALEKAVHGERPGELEHGLPSAEIDRYVQGFAFKDESKSGADRLRTIRWPSLFKVYKLDVVIDSSDNAILVKSPATDAM